MPRSRSAAATIVSDLHPFSHGSPVRRACGGCVSRLLEGDGEMSSHPFGRYLFAMDLVCGYVSSSRRRCCGEAASLDGSRQDDVCFRSKMPVEGEDSWLPTNPLPGGIRTRVGNRSNGIGTVRHGPLTPVAHLRAGAHPFPDRQCRLRDRSPIASRPTGSEQPCQRYHLEQLRPHLAKPLRRRQSPQRH